MLYYIKLLRPLNLLMIALTMILFRISIVSASPYELFLLMPVLSNAQFALLVLITLLVAGGGYVINDVFDADIDAVNKPESVIINKYIPDISAYNFYKILCILAFILTLVLAFLTKSYRLSMFPVIIIVLLNFYAQTFKKQLLIGNIIISLCAAAVLWLIAFYESGQDMSVTPDETYVSGGIAIGAMVYGLFAFLTTFIREVVKDCEDVVGDEQFGCNTVPVKWGFRGAKKLLYLLYILLFLFTISFIFFFKAINIIYPIKFIVVILILPIFVLVFFTIRAQTKSNYHLLSNLIKGYMLMGILTMLYFRMGIGPYIFTQYVNYLEKLF